MIKPVELDIDAILSGAEAYLGLIETLTKAQSWGEQRALLMAMIARSRQCHEDVVRLTTDVTYQLEVEGISRGVIE